MRRRSGRHFPPPLRAMPEMQVHCLQGLAALLVKGLSGCGAEEIVRVEASDVIDALGLSASLTPSRNNGFLNMFRLMQKKALVHLTEQVSPSPQSPTVRHFYFFRQADWKAKCICIFKQSVLRAMSDLRPVAQNLDSSRSLAAPHGRRT